MGFETRAASNTLLPFGGVVWRFLDSGFLPDPTWYSPSYIDSSWKSGFGQFGYGEGDEQTLISYGPNPLNKYVTTYFRGSFNVTTPGLYSTVMFRLIRDSGARVYLNGSELYRDNLGDPEEYVDNNTYSLGCLTAERKATIVTNVFPATILQSGQNLVAVEIHQCAPAAVTMSFDLEILGEINPANVSVNRGPYLQVGTSSNIVVRWRTDNPSSTRVRYGASAGNLNQSAVNGLLTTEHEIILPNLLPATKYFYDIGTTNQALAGDVSYFFVTAPVPGTVQPVRFWAIGDAGTGFPVQSMVRDSYASFAGNRYTDLWLMLGDNAYCCGFDNEYQAYVFNVYPTLLRQSVVWPTVGNHETVQDTSLSDNFPYYDIFTMPRNGEAGGVPSGSEHYYSYDYANIHFVCLDSMTAIFRQPNSAMLTWLQADLANNTRDWIVAYWHHPPYTKGSHNSDAEFDLGEIRRNIVPILESYGVDLVFCGHSHNYERSYLIDGHYGTSGSFRAANLMNTGSGRTNGTGAYLKPAGGFGERRGTVYIVDGSSGGQGTGGALNHPAMFYSTYDAGSVVVDVNGLRLDATFIRYDGAVNDSFTIDKTAMPLQIARAGTNAHITWPATDVRYQLESKSTVNPVASWSPSAANVLTNDRRKLSILPIMPGTNQFFQLRRVS